VFEKGGLMVQLLLDGSWERDEAIASLRKKYQVWIDRIGAPVLSEFLITHELFTTDDVWEAFTCFPSPTERRVMGALIRGFAVKGLIIKTGVFERSNQPECHRRDKALWRSLIFDGHDRVASRIEVASIYRAEGV
jgi:hypothetical protein